MDAMNAKKRMRFPRRFWCIKPFDRIHESKKWYNRQRLKRELRRELEELNV
jgi:hypothetical protein